ncbi:MAG: hypothetical protein ACTS3F_15010 [Phycisphaerales bacterium]
MKSILCGATVLALAGTASAASFVQSLPYGGSLSPYQATLQFQQLDESTLGLGPDEFIVVKSVIVTVDGEITANVTAENDSDIAAPDFGVNLTGFTSASITGASASFNIFQVASSGGVAASDGVAGSGPDFFDFGQLADSDSDDDKTFGPFDDFLGNGTFDAVVFASGGFAVTGATDSTLEVTDFQTNGTVTVEIIYNIIPTPGAMALFGVAGLAAVRRRRA